MNLKVRMISAMAISAIVAGCDQPEGTGAVVTTTVVERESGKMSMATLYGYSTANNKIAFAIFTNIEDADHGDEIDRLRAQREIQDFLKK